MNSLKNLIDRQRKDEGFTVIELMIVVIVIGILAAIVWIAYAAQIRAGLESTVKADVSSNKAVMVNASDKGAKNGLYLTPDDFMARATFSEGNTFGYITNTAQDKACLWVSHEFEAGDIVTWEFNSEVGKMSEIPFADKCAGVLSGAIILPPGGGGGTTPSGGGTTPSGGGGGSTPPVVSPPGQFGITAMGDTVYTTTITQNDPFYACLLFRVNTTSATPVPWGLTLDKSVAPWNGNTTDNRAGNGNVVMDENTTRIHMYGTYGVTNASITDTVTFELCTPGRPIIGAVGNVTNVPAGAPAGGSFFASQSFVVTGNTNFYSNWSTVVDLGPLLTRGDRTNGRPRINNMPGGVLTHEGGTIYRISSFGAPDRALKEGVTQNIVMAVG